MSGPHIVPLLVLCRYIKYYCTDMKFKLLLILTVISARMAVAQDVAYAHKLVDTLTSPYFWGRGYTNNGVGKAAKFITQQFKQYGLKPLSGNDFAQPFSYAPFYKGSRRRTSIS